MSIRSVLCIAETQEHLRILVVVVVVVVAVFDAFYVTDDHERSL